MSARSFFRKSWDFYSQMLIQYPITTKGLTCGVCITTSDVFTQHKQFISNREEKDSNSETTTSSHTHEILRSIKVFTYGTILLGPSLHFWFRALDRMLPRMVVVNSTNHQTITLPFRKIPFLNKYITSESGVNSSGRNSKWMKLLHLDWMNKFSKDQLSWSAKRVVVEQLTYSVMVTFMFFIATSALDLLFDDFEKEQEEGKSFFQKFDNFPQELKQRIENEFQEVHQNGMKYVPIANFINFLGRFQ